MQAINSIEGNDNRWTGVWVGEIKEENWAKWQACTIWEIGVWRQDMLLGEKNEGTLW